MLDVKVLIPGLFLLPGFKNWLPGEKKRSQIKTEWSFGLVLVYYTIIIFDNKPYLASFIPKHLHRNWAQYTYYWIEIKKNSEIFENFPGNLINICKM